MITANEIKKKAENLYIEYLKSIIMDEIFFPKEVRCDKSVLPNCNKSRKELAEVIGFSKDRNGFGYTIFYKQRKTRQDGIQSSISKIIFQTESDFLKYLHKEKEVVGFRENCSLILSKYYELKEWLVKYPKKVIKNKNQWNNILKVCSYFKHNPTPNNLYIRELPIEVDTKFIEDNKSILKELLNILIEEHIQRDEKDFEKRFNLKYEEAFVRFRILDKQISQVYFSGVDYLNIPISQFEKLNLSPLKKVFVVENKMNVLTFPIVAESIVIFGSGFGVGNLLKNSSWLNNIELFYWGDLDIQGFEILSQFKSHFPHVKSILMDKATFKYFENAKVKGKPSNNSEVLDLTDEERKLYILLKGNNWRLEQEKIRLEYVKEFLHLLQNP